MCLLIWSLVLIHQIRILFISDYGGPVGQIMAMALDYLKNIKVTFALIFLYCLYFTNLISPPFHILYAVMGDCVMADDGAGLHYKDYSK